MRWSEIVLVDGFSWGETVGEKLLKTEVWMYIVDSVISKIIRLEGCPAKQMHMLNVSFIGYGAVYFFPR